LPLFDSFHFFKFSDIFWHFVILLVFQCTNPDEIILEAIIRSTTSTTAETSTILTTTEQDESVLISLKITQFLSHRHNVCSIIAWSRGWVKKFWVGSFPNNENLKLILNYNLFIWFRPQKTLNLGAINFNLLTCKFHSFLTDSL
jgi:hypothetical protein